MAPKNPKKVGVQVGAEDPAVVAAREFRRSPEGREQANAEHTPHIRSAAHQALIDREFELEVAAVKANKNPRHAVAADRLSRWAKHPLLATEDTGLAEWAMRMTQRFGAATVAMWYLQLGWVMALAVARYGEAEDHWPTAFTDADRLRAEQWFIGGWTPEGVKFAAGASALGRPKLQARPS